MIHHRVATAERRVPGSWSRMLASVAALAVVAVGIPIGLTVLSRFGLGAWHPVPGIGSFGDIKSALDHQLSSSELSSAVLRVILGFCWLLWIGMLLSVLSAIVAARPALSGVRLPRLSIFEGVGAWIAAGLIVVSSFNPQSVRAAGQTLPTPTAQVVTVATASQPRSLSASQTTSRPGWVTVQVGESVQMVAERALGNGTRWPEIWSLNKDRAIGPDGATWREPWRLSPGWELQLPPTDTPVASVRSTSLPVTR